MKLRVKLSARAIIFLDNFEEYLNNIYYQLSTVKVET